MSINKSLVGVSPIYSEIEFYAAELEKRALRMEKLLESSPEGSIKINRKEYVKRCKNNQGYSYEHLRKDSPAAKALGDKKIATDSLRTIERNLKAANAFLKFHSTIEDDEYANALINRGMPHSKRFFLSLSDKAEKWLANNPGNTNTIEKQKSITTLSGNAVRSKAEGIIDDGLFKHWGTIVYRYESELYLQKTNRYVCPDFLVYIPESGKEIVWEHFGLMDDPSYASDKCKLIRAYQAEGYVLGDTFICTFESSAHPISSGYIDTIIKTHILNGIIKQD